MIACQMLNFIFYPDVRLNSPKNKNQNRNQKIFSKLIDISGMFLIWAIFYEDCEQISSKRVYKFTKQINKHFTCCVLIEHATGKMWIFV